MLLKKRCWWKIAWVLPWACVAWGGTFGTVVSIGGQAADIALDESRGVLYIANFTANRIEVMSLANNTIQTSINVAPQPSSIALSPDAHYLVITHFGNFTSPTPPSNALTVVDLTNNGKQTFALSDPPLGVAFGLDGQALVVTTTSFLLFDPVLGTTQELKSIQGLIAPALPASPGTPPLQITSASMAASGDGSTIYGMGGFNGTFTFHYDVDTKIVQLADIPVASQTILGSCTAVPSQGVVVCGAPTIIPGTLGPTVVSVNQNGSLFLAGWRMIDNKGNFTHQFPNPANLANVGSTAFDTNRGLVYAQIPASGDATMALQILDVDNLAVLQRLKLSENLTGKSLLSADGNTLYAVSQSGATVMPVGSLANQSMVVPAQQDLIFRGSTCTRGITSQNLNIVNPGGGATPFSISTLTPGITVSPSSGITPTTVQVSVDPTAFQNQKGTSQGQLHIASSQAINVTNAACQGSDCSPANPFTAIVRVLVNNPDPDQRGTIVDIPGTLSDLLADPVRNQYYILRQDTNQLLVFDGSNNTQIAALKTGNVPNGMAITFDQQYLLVANESSNFISVFDLETMQPANPIYLTDSNGPHTAQSVAASAGAILAATTDVQGVGRIMKLNLTSGTGTEYTSLGVFTNLVDTNTAMTASPNGSSILIAGADGNVFLYDANADSFTVSRNLLTTDVTALSGAYAASSYNQYVVGNTLLNSSLVPVLPFGATGNASSGFAFVNRMGYMTTVPGATTSTTGTGASSGAPSASTATQSSAPGVIQSADLSTTQVALTLATRMVEAPLLGTTTNSFTRTLAPLYNQNAIVNLTVSGFTVLPWDYSASVAPPLIQSVVNAADGSPAIAPGGLISIYGQQFSPVNIATSEIPVPTALADSCLSVNGLPVPMLFVSPTQINAQLPFQAVGNVTMILNTPGGVSNNFNTVVQAQAPSVFMTTVQGLGSNVPAVVRVTNGEIVTPANPVHKNDYLVIYLTGLGITNPATQAGFPGPANPLASAIVSPQITLGGTDLPLLYAGMAPGEIGVYQINVQVPASVPSGLSIPLTISQGGMDTTIQVRIVD